MNHHDLKRLIDRYLAGKASEQEKEWLHQYYDDFQEHQNWDEAELGSSQETEERIWNRLKKRIRMKAPVAPVAMFGWWKAAAAFIVLLGLSVLWMTRRDTAKRMVPVQANAGITQKASKDATLLLAGGEKILLDSVADGVLAMRENAIIRKNGNRVTVAALKDNSTGLLPEYHTLNIPRGKQYEVVLADGSTVWLNAASSLRFPTAFAGNERMIKLTGEAYFDVTRDEQKPFRVFAVGGSPGNETGAMVEVLGTRFNINAYEDEALLKTTLLQGEVKISGVEGDQSATTDPVVLQPGQQAQFVTHSPAGKKTVVQAVDLESVVAWKSNYFDFHAADIQAIMRQIARWYDVDVVFQGSIAGRTFTGKISRNTALETVLEILEQSDIHFRVRGKTIVVGS